MQPQSIAIIGAGTAGLATAALLAEQGHHITLIERAEALAPVGAGLLLQPTGLSVLKDRPVSAQGHGTLPGHAGIWRPR